MPIAPGPTPVAGDIQTNTIWYSGASPYILEGDVTVKDKALLTIEPGTEIKSKVARWLLKAGFSHRETMNTLSIWIRLRRERSGQE